MSINTSGPDKENKELTRLVLTGIGIGFAIALGLYGLKSLLSPSIAARPITQSMGTSSPSSGSSAQNLKKTATLVATPTPILFQFDQMWAAVGDPAPEFTLSTLEGKRVSLAEFKGRPVIVNFWATWCQYCKEEMTAYQAVFDQYQNTGLVILGINVIEKDDLAKVEEFVGGLHLTFPILLDTDSSTIAAKYGVNGLPASYFIDADGILRRIQIGAMTQETIENYAQELMADH